MQGSAGSGSVHIHSTRGLRGLLPLLPLAALALLAATTALSGFHPRFSAALGVGRHASARALSDSYWGLSPQTGKDGRFSLVPLTPGPSAATTSPYDHEASPTDAPEPEAAGSAWLVEPKPYYSWMWADAAIRPAPLDLGHGGAKDEPTVWSSWLGRKAAIQDLQLYQTADNFGRPVEMRIAAAMGGLPEDAIHGQLLPGSKRFLSKFASMDEAIDYLSRGGAALSRDWYTAGNASSSTAPVASTLAAGEIQAGTSASTSLAPSVSTTEQKLGTAARQDDSSDGSGMAAGTIIGYLGYIGFVPCLAFIGWIGFRLFRRDGCRETDIVTSAGEEDTACDSEDPEEGPGAANPWQAFMGVPREGEMRRLLLFAEGDMRRLPPLPPEGGEAPVGPAQRPIAEAEVERILATRDPSGIFGNVDAAGRKQEFRRLLRLLHPDKGLVAGDRATLALRRMVEAYRALAANP